MMFPVSAFDEDDREEGLPPIPDQNARARMFDPDPEPPAEPDRNGRGNGLGRLNPLSRIRNEYNDIYNGGHGSDVMNLKELDAYVQETVKAQRQQRRKELLTKVAIIVSFVIIVTAMFGSSIFVFEDVRGSHPFAKRSFGLYKKPLVKYELPPGYVQSQCEVELTQNISFYGLIEEAQSLDGKAACRPEVRCPMEFDHLIKTAFVHPCPPL